MPLDLLPAQVAQLDRPQMRLVEFLLSGEAGQDRGGRELAALEGGRVVAPEAERVAVPTSESGELLRMRGET